ncbi:phosphonate metabolism transcriptional regulator PhnF [Salinarimonas ramus]|uniref:Phosphonate metabolism transcriptional regulator PhnF n=1 Tax=Salinarimonas ramus TaxID=690164 RepID=A0A917QCA1_9HYPH|nr:phosphonate metabolism transcriptional regulator PhnF [Salinarimonas ramus]GGK44142.1 phosphonate metabolism transcriptional regulator PhnF [Salinarimonas ramus]
MDELVNRGAGVAAWKQIADAIEADIRDGHVPPGERLAPEPALAERFGVNRHTVRRAVAALAARGLVRVAHGRGTFVEAGPIPYTIGARTRFSEIVSRTGHEAGGEIVSSGITQADATTAERLRIPVGAPVLAARFRRFVDGLPFSHGRTALPLPRFSRFLDAFSESRTISAAFAACGVPEYRRAWTEVSARISTAADEPQLEIAPGRILFVVESVNVDPDGVPIQASSTLFPADRATLRLES